MTRSLVKFASLINTLPIAGLLLSVQPQTALAGAAADTCSSYLTQTTVTNSISMGLNSGERLVATASNGNEVTGFANKTSLGPSSTLVYTATSDGTDIFLNLAGLAAEALGHAEVGKKKTITSITVQCFLAGTAPPTTKELQETLTNVITNAQNGNLGGAIGGAVGGGFGNGGGTSPFISQNGFSISSRGLSALANNSQIKEPKLNLNKEVQDQIYGAEIDLTNVPETSPWNVWATGRYDRYKGDSSSFDGNVATLNAGADYRVSETFLLGGLIGYGTADIDVGTTDNLESDGYTIGTYFGAKLGGTVIADGFIAYTKSSYDVRSAISTGSFDSDRVTAGVNVYGSLPMDGFTLQPGVSFIYGSEKQDDYIDSTASAVAGQTIKSGRVSIGPKLIFDAVETGSGSFSPWVAAKYEYDFSDANNVANTTAPDVGDSSSARLSAGFSTDFGAGTFSLSGDVGGLGSGDYISYGGAAKIRIPLD